MKCIVIAAVKPVMLALWLFLHFNRVEAQPKQERFQSINIQLRTLQSSRSFKPIQSFIMRCPKKDFGLRISGKIKRPPRDITATRFALSISIKPFIKPKTHKL
jgi:hypothetical protein